MNKCMQLELTGLVGSSPIGALSAFGLLRVCREIPDLKTAKLSWILRDDWIAVLHIEPGINQEGFIKYLCTHHASRTMEVFEWGDDIRVKPEEFRSRIIDKARSASVEKRSEADYFSAFGSEVAIDGSKGLVKPTAFHMTSGQQKFLDSVNNLGKQLKDDSREAFREALFGPWRYKDSQHSLGWDPITERMYALRHRAPTSEAPTSVRAAIWLAVEALPLFPTVAHKDRRLSTTGFSRNEDQVVFTWPVWVDPIGLDTLRSLLGASELYGKNESHRKILCRGVAGVYRSVRSEFGQGYAIFRPAKLVYGVM